jgi:succinoglycan biosynthesis protein ExoA
MSDILAVIPCLNEALYLERLVLKVLAMGGTNKLRIIIADGGSTDGSLEIAQRLSSLYENVKYLHNPKRIQSCAVNLAIETCADDAEFLLRLDAHSDYPDNYCQKLLDEANLTGADSIVVAVDTIGVTGFQRAVAAAQNSKLGNGGSAHRTPNGNGIWVDHGHHGLMRIDAFRAVGGYDETFTHNEDAELDIRLGKAGYKIWLTNKVMPVYYPRATPYSLFRQYTNYGNGRMHTILKHRVRPRLRQLAPAAIIPILVIAFLSPLFPIAALPLLCWMALCLGYGVRLGIRARSFWVALAGPAAMIMHVGWGLGFWRQFLSLRSIYRDKSFGH